MSRKGRNDAMHPKHINPENVIFSLFTSEELKKICVVKIVTPLMLDTLGHPLPGGLYDIRLGPLSDSGDPCGTCKKNMYFCPGHFGYIELPLPTVNPLFHKIIGTVLKISCLSCYHIQIPVHIKHSLSIQIKLLNCGMVIEALEIGNKIAELIAQYKSFENIPEDCFLDIANYEKLATEAYDKLEGKFVINKNVEALRNQFINDILREVKVAKFCKFCRKPINRIQALKNKIILHMKKTECDVTPSTSVMSSKVHVSDSKYITPEESRRYMRNIWEEESDLLKQMISVLNGINIEHPTDVFYFDIIPVPPPNVRPVNIVLDRVLENPQSRTYQAILKNTILLRTVIQVVQNKGDVSSLPAEGKSAYSYARGNSPVEKLNNLWEELQAAVDSLIDKDTTRNAEGVGLKQLIEKKTGVIRQNMMGKRVNFAARSVITPDPNLNIDEIGIPEAFAKQLTYPVPVTPWNVEEMRKMILNGPEVHPGAVMVELEDGTLKRINSANQTQQESILKCLLTPYHKVFKGVKIVHRHLCNGDVLLLNRQPTLHKPSIMAHTARILKGEKTLRLHYANCKAYNADFDGDEMNAHFPQNELARSEGYNLANVSNQYLVPKDGTPLSGLIQDHMIAGVRMSIRGRFFNKMDYQQLVYQALSFKTGKVTLLPPSIIKPARLWSGKQILSTVIMNIIPEGRQLINLTATSKIPAKAWEVYPSRKWEAGGTLFENPNCMSEAEVIIRGAELLVGVLDKTHYGATPYGLVHCVYELYGGSYAIKLLSSFAKLFTRFLQQEGFTLGVRDILTVKSADKKRKRIIKKSRLIGKNVIKVALNLPEDTSLEEIVEKIEENSVTDPKLRAVIDRQYKTSLDTYTNEINKVCLPAGLVCKFPHNNLQLMVQSGAKGSTVNTMQISCLLGQIELEGKRPPVMISGKSLPSFPAFEFSPRAGGFIDGRFMTGIQPQEFFFHCMAGREGLIDTAVKTSRSGYLQRCLIKHLEGLHVGYDMTVRDSDKSVVQFFYGEDGLDISKAQFLNAKQFPFLSENSKGFTDKKTLKQLKNSEEQKAMKKHKKMIDEWLTNYGEISKSFRKSPFSLFSKVVASKIGKKGSDRNIIMRLWAEADETIKDSFRQHCVPCPDPLVSKYQPDSSFGALNERLQMLLDQLQSYQDKKQKKQFQDMLKLKVMQSFCAPGEPVGLLAAQSIGEPSTQMTLNTFHFAGRGEMNVTLGIPRLREILMMASKNIKTPSMEIPFLQVDALEEKAELVRKMLTRVVVADVLEKIDVTYKLEVEPVRQHKYILKFKFLPQEYYEDQFCVTPKYIMKYMSNRFFSSMFTAIGKFSKIKSNIVAMEEERRPVAQRGNMDDDDDEGDNRENTQNLGEQDRNDESSDEEVEDEDDAKTMNKYNQAHEDQEPEEEEKENESSEDEGEADLNLSATQTTEEAAVVESHRLAQNYVFDKKRHRWCEITFAMPLNCKKLDLTAILKDVAAKSVVYEAPQIKRAITYMKDNKLMLRTDGINIGEMFKYHHLLDLNKLYCNDIHKIAETYGIEAAAKIIVKEVKDVFNVYGIKVDPRHLSLIADYMTTNGTFEPLSRKGMESSASPLQQMSFESSLTFLKAAVIRGKHDGLQNPSSCLMLGKPCATGTGSFSLLQKIPNMMTVNT